MMTGPIAYILCGFVACIPRLHRDAESHYEKTPRRCNVRGATQNLTERFRVMDIVGQEFGRWKVIEFLGRDERSVQHFLCRCQCGIERSVQRSNLLRGVSRSCGCLKLEQSKVRPLTHGGTVGGKRAPGYESWAGMKKRCTNARCEDYPNYGGRGIVICNRWSSFANFIEDMGPPPVGSSIDRIDVNGNYEPGNCRWATDLQQSQNRTNVHRLTYGGETKCMAEWSRCLGVSVETLRGWVNRGVAFEDVVLRFSRKKEGIA